MSVRLSFHLLHCAGRGIAEFRSQVPKKSNGRISVQDLPSIDLKFMEIVPRVLGKDLFLESYKKAPCKPPRDVDKDNQRNKSNENQDKILFICAFV